MEPFYLEWMFIIVITLSLRCLQFLMSYDNSYMEVYFILILPLIFSTRCVSTKPLHRSFLRDTMEDIHDGTKNTSVKQVRLDQNSTRLALKRRLLVTKGLENCTSKPVLKSHKIKEEIPQTEMEIPHTEMTLKAEKNLIRLIENNFSDVDQTNLMKVNRTDYNLFTFYWEKKKRSDSISPILSPNSKDVDFTSLVKHNVPFDNNIYQTTSQPTHNGTSLPKRTDKLNKKSSYVSEEERKRSIVGGFHLELTSDQFGKPLQTPGTKSESGKSHLTTDERTDKAKSSKGFLPGSRVLPQAAAKAPRLESGKLSSSNAPLRSEDEQLEMKSGMSDLEAMDSMQKNNRANFNYEETTESDRSEDFRQRRVGSDQAVNETSVQTEVAFKEENWNKSSDEMVDVYDHAEMMKVDENNAGNAARDGLLWQQKESFSRASNHNDVSVNSFKTSSDNHVNVISYAREKLPVGFPPHSDRQTKGHTETMTAYINQSNLIKFFDGKELIGENGKKYGKREKPHPYGNKRRDDAVSYVPLSFTFVINHLSGGDPEEVHEKLGQWKSKMATGSRILNKLTDTVSRTSPSYFGQIQNVNLRREDGTRSRKIVDKQNTQTNFKFDYRSVDNRESVDSDSIKRPPIQKNFRMTRYLWRTVKTGTQHLRNRRDLDVENSTQSTDGITSLALTRKEGSTSITTQFTTKTSFIQQSEDAVTMETELIHEMRQEEVTDDTNNRRWTFTKSSVQQGNARDSLGDVNLIVSIQSDSSILYIMPSLVLLTLLVLAAEGIRRWRTIQKAQARVQLLPPSGGVNGDFTIENPLAFDSNVPSTSKSQPGTSSEDSGSPGIGKGPFTISHTNEFPTFNTFPHRSRRTTQDRSSSFDSSRQCCCTWCLIKSSDVQTTRL